MSEKRGEEDKRTNMNGRGLSEEEAIFDTFLKVIRNKFAPTPDAPTEYEDDNSSKTAEDRIKRLDDLYNGPEYSSEKAMITNMNNNGMTYGLALGLCTFVFLRRGPRLISNLIVKKKQRRDMSGGGYTFDNDPSDNMRKPGIIFRTVKFCMDIGVSLTVSMYGSAMFVDRKQLLRDLSEVPLVEGRSLISDALCSDFVDVYKGIPKNTWKKYEGKSEPLDAISNFVMNCIRRKKVEDNLREQERHFGTVDSDVPKHIPIPKGGVDPNTAVTVEFGDTSEDILVGKEAEDSDDFYNGFVQDFFGDDEKFDDAKSDSDGKRKS